MPGTNGDLIGHKYNCNYEFITSSGSVNYKMLVYMGNRGDR